MSDLPPYPKSDRLGPPPPGQPPAVAIAVEDWPQRDPFWTWTEFVMFTVLFLAASLLFGLGANFLGLALRLDSTTRTALSLLSQFLGYGFGFVCLAMMFRLRFRQPFWRSLGWRMDRWLVVPMLGSGALLAAAVLILSNVLRTRPVRSPMEELMRDPQTALILGALAVTVGPLCEELMFRGLLQPLLVRAVGTAAGILIASLPFALLHGPQYGWSWQHVTLIALAGAAFGAVRHRTGSTALATIMHASYNFTFFALFILFQRETF